MSKLLKSSVEDGSSLSLRPPIAKVEEHNNRLEGCFLEIKVDRSQLLAQVIQNIQCSFDMLYLSYFGTISLMGCLIMNI